MTRNCHVRFWSGGGSGDALAHRNNAGTMPLPRLEDLVAEHPLETSTAWYAVDASVWPRCDAETSPERGYYHHSTRQSHGQPIVAGWNYSWRVLVPERCSSWTAPLRVRRIRPGENVNQVAAEQIRSFLPQRRAGQPCPIFTFDAGYDPVQLGVALNGLDVSALIRLRSGRCFYADPSPEPTGGRPRRHGAKFVCDDPTSLSHTNRRVEHHRCGLWSGAAPVLERTACDPTKPREEGNAPSSSSRSRNPHSPGGGASPQTQESARASLALVVGAGAAKFGGHLASVCGPVLHRTRLSLLQTGAQMDDPQAPFSGGRRSLDLVGDPGVRPTSSGPSPGCRSSPARACASLCGKTDACSSAPGLFATSATTGPAGVRAKTLWTLTRTSPMDGDRNRPSGFQRSN